MSISIMAATTINSVRKALTGIAVIGFVAAFAVVMPLQVDLNSLSLDQVTVAAAGPGSGGTTGDGGAGAHDGNGGGRSGDSTNGHGGHGDDGAANGDNSYSTRPTFQLTLSRPRPTGRGLLALATLPPTRTLSDKGGRAHERLRQTATMTSSAGRIQRPFFWRTLAWS